MKLLDFDLRTLHNVHLQRNNNLLRADSLHQQIHTLLDFVQAGPDHHGFGGGDKLPARQGLGQIVLVHGLSDIVVLERGAEDGLHGHPLGGFGETSFCGGDELVVPFTLGDQARDGLPGRGADAVERSRAGAGPERRQEVLQDRGAVVVVHLGRTQGLDQAEIPGGRRGDDLVARRDGELDGVAPDAGSAAPDQQCLTRGLLGGRRRRVPQVEVRVLEQGARRRRKTQRDHRGLFVAEVVGDRRGHVGLEDGVQLESIVRVALRRHPHSATRHAVADLEPGDVGPDGRHLARDVHTQNRRVVHGPPRKGLNAAVDRVDGEGVVAHEDLVRLGSPHRRRLDLERACFGFDEPRGAVAGGRHG